MDGPSWTGEQVTQFVRARSIRFPFRFDTEIAGHHQMWRRMIAPVSCQHIEVGHCHFIDLADRVAACGRQQSVNMRQAAATASPDCFSSGDLLSGGFRPLAFMISTIASDAASIS